MIKVPAGAGACGVDSRSPEDFSPGQIIEQRLFVFQFFLVGCGWPIRNRAGQRCRKRIWKPRLDIGFVWLNLSRSISQNRFSGHAFSIGGSGP